MSEANPEISVVMGVYNGAEQLERSLESILTQEGVDLEFIVVDDGSTDVTPEILARVGAGDSRLKVIRQANKGMTEALIQGCAAAKGEFIARQDCGDRSLPGKLRRQVAALEQDRELVFHSCGTRFVTEEGIELFSRQLDTADLERGLRAAGLKDFHGPSSHPSVVFRRAAYERCGGYRRQFYFAQDLDLWVRLIGQGGFVAEEWIGYEAAVSAASLSGRNKLGQEKLRKIIYDLSRSPDTRVRESLLSQAEMVMPQKGSRRASDWRGNYFIGACLAKSHPAEARAYFRKVVKEKPLHWKAWMKLLRA